MHISHETIYRSLFIQSPTKKQATVLVITAALFLSNLQGSLGQVGSSTLAKIQVASAPLELPSPQQPRLTLQSPSHSDWLTPSLHSGFVLLLSHTLVSSLWSEAFDPTQVSRNWVQFKQSYRMVPVFDLSEDFFEWDGDGWSVNLVGHGLMGSEFYLQHRAAHHSPLTSVIMAFAWSTLWEYGVESWYKPPSGIDLVWTPLGGALIGEGRYQLYRLAQNIENNTLKNIALSVVDPFGQLRRLLF